MFSYETRDSVIHFLAVPDGKAKTIVCEIEKLFQVKKISWEELSSSASNGAATVPKWRMGQINRTFKQVGAVAL